MQALKAGMERCKDYIVNACELLQLEYSAATSKYRVTNTVVADSKSFPHFS